MATIGSLAVTLGGVDAMIASTTSLAAHLSPDLAECLPKSDFGRLILGDDVSGLARVESIEGAAPRAGVLHGLRVLPEKGYLELVAAVVADGDAYVSSEVHGWPILSSVCCSTTMADGAAESIRGTGSAEA